MNMGTDIPCTSRYEDMNTVSSPEPLHYLANSNPVLPVDVADRNFTVQNCKTQTVDTTPIKARVLLLVKTGAGNLIWCVGGVNYFSEVNAGSGFRLFSCVPRILMYNNPHMTHIYTQTLPDFPSYALSDLRNSERKIKT